MRRDQLFSVSQTEQLAVIDTRLAADGTATIVAAPREGVHLSFQSMVIGVDCHETQASATHAT